MNWWQKALSLLVASGLAFALVTLGHQSEAEACTTGPPPPQCGVALNPSVAVAQTAVNDDSGGLTADMSVAVYMNVAGSPWQGCPTEGTNAQFELEAECQQAGTEDSVVGGSASFSGTIEQGLQRFPVSMGVDPGVPRNCTVGGSVTVVFDTGHQLTTKITDQAMCATQPAPNDPSEPAIDLRVNAGEDGVVSARPGDPKILPYEITNNTEENFSGILRVTSVNTESPIEGGEPPPPDPNPAEVCDDDYEPPSDVPEECSDSYEPECGCDMEVYSNACERNQAGVQKLDDESCPESPPSVGGYAVSMVNDGDSFPLIFREDGPEDACIPMPDNPAESDDVSISQGVEVPAGETVVVEVVQRAWSLCSDGSCSRTSAGIAGQLESGGDIAACGGASFVVMEEAEPSDAGSDAEGPSVCDTGDVPESDDWNDPDEPDFEPPEYPDSDGDGVPDFIEDAYDLDPNDPSVPANPDDYSWEALLETDTDGDGVPDMVEILYGFDHESDEEPANPDDYSKEALMNMDSDGNGVSDYEEIYIYQADPLDGDMPQFYIPYHTIDTDENGVPDQIEVIYGFDPLDSDQPPNPDDYSCQALLDQDEADNGVPDYVEIAFGFDPLDPETPADTANYSEAALSSRDGDGDGLTPDVEINTMCEEYGYYTKPDASDTDNDTYGDGDEFETMDTNPLDPYDPAEQNWSNTPVAGVIFEGSTADRSTLVKGLGSQVEGDVEVDRTTATAYQLTPQIGRIHETVELQPDTVDAGDQMEFAIPFEVSLLDENSPYSIEELQVGVKPMDSDADGSYLVGGGTIKLDSEPYTLIDFMYRVSLWVEDPETSGDVGLTLADGDFQVDGNSFEVTLTTEVPEFGFENIDLTHDLNAYEQDDVVEICDDGNDTNNNGLVDCDDPYCGDDPACIDDPDPVSCDGAGDCGAGEVCFGGICQSDSGFASCSTQADCAGGESCVSGSCLEDDDLVACSGDSECNSDESCVSGSCVPQSFADCSSDTDCSDSELCTDSTCVSEDELTTCDSDGQCLSNETCDGGYCVPAEDGGGGCAADAECSGDDVCDGGSCTDPGDVDEDDNDEQDEDTSVERSCTTTGDGAPVGGGVLLLLIGLAFAKRRNLREALVEADTDG